jgi:hypothetical protein
MQRGPIQDHIFSFQRFYMPLYAQAKLNMVCLFFDSVICNDLQKQRQQILQISHNIE